MAIADTKKKIIRAFAEQISSGGFDQADPRKIADAAGLSSTTIYSRYKTMDEIASDTFQAGCEHVLMRTATYYMSSPATETASKIRTLIEGLFSAYDADPALTSATVVIVAQSALRPTLRKMIRSSLAYERLKTLLQGQRDQMMSGGDDKDRIDAFSEVMIAAFSRYLFLMSSLSEESKIWNTKSRRKVVIDILSEIVLEFIGKRAKANPSSLPLPKSEK